MTRTKRSYTIFGITIPEGTKVIDTESCAVLVRYDESKGFSFDNSKNKLWRKPRHNTLITIPRDLAS
jgi:hypothetical protein